MKARFRSRLDSTAHDREVASLDGCGGLDCLQCATREAEGFEPDARCFLTADPYDVLVGSLKRGHGQRLADDCRIRARAEAEVDAAVRDFERLDIRPCEKTVRCFVDSCRCRIGRRHRVIPERSDNQPLRCFSIYDACCNLCAHQVGAVHRHAKRDDDRRSDDNEDELDRSKAVGAAVVEWFAPSGTESPKARAPHEREGPRILEMPLRQRLTSDPYRQAAGRYLVMLVPVPSVPLFRTATLADPVPISTVLAGTGAAPHFHATERSRV